MNKKILFLDLDGTLLNDRKEVTRSNRAAIKKALAAGHRIVITSGRPLVSTLALARRLELAGPGCFVIAYNGAEVYDCSRQEVVSRRALEAEDLYAVFDEAERRGLYIQTYDREHVVIEGRCDPEVARRYCGVIGIEFRLIGDVRRDLSEMPVKALLIDFRDRAPLIAMEEWLHTRMSGRVDCFFSSQYYLEVMPVGMNKGAAVEDLCRRLGIPISDAVAAGDEANDIAMLQAAGVGAAMANAAPAVKEAADYVTERDNNHDGIAEIIEKFML